VNDSTEYLELIIKQGIPEPMECESEGIYELMKKCCSNGELLFVLLLSSLIHYSRFTFTEYHIRPSIQKVKDRLMEIKNSEATSIHRHD